MSHGDDEFGLALIGSDFHRRGQVSVRYCRFEAGKGRGSGGGTSSCGMLSEVEEQAARARHINNVCTRIRMSPRSKANLAGFNRKGN
jgi:hypothetical protein